jgi:hypothetical protein
MSYGVEDAILQRCAAMVALSATFRAWTGADEEEDEEAIQAAALAHVHINQATSDGLTDPLCLLSTEKFRLERNGAFSSEAWPTGQVVFEFEGGLTDEDSYEAQTREFMDTVRKIKHEVWELSLSPTRQQFQAVEELQGPRPRTDETEAAVIEANEARIDGLWWGFFVELQGTRR